MPGFRVRRFWSTSILAILNQRPGSSSWPACPGFCWRNETLAPLVALQNHDQHLPRSDLAAAQTARPRGSNTRHVVSMGIIPAAALDVAATFAADVVTAPLPVALATVVPLALTVPGKTPYATMAEMFKAMQQPGAIAIVIRPYFIDYDKLAKDRRNVEIGPDVLLLRAASLGDVVQRRHDDRRAAPRVEWRVVDEHPARLAVLEQCRLVDDSGAEQPLQAKVAATWDGPRGSVRWLTIDFLSRWRNSMGSSTVMMCSVR